MEKSQQGGCRRDEKGSEEPEQAGALGKDASVGRRAGGQHADRGDAHPAVLTESPVPVTGPAGEAMRSM